MIVHMTAAQPDIEGQIVTNLPDRADQGRFDLSPSEVTPVGDLGDGANRPFMRAFEDGADKQIGVLFAGDLRYGIEMHRNRLPSLRQDARDAATSPVLIVNAGQQYP